MNSEKLAQAQELQNRISKVRQQTQSIKAKLHPGGKGQLPEEPNPDGKSVSGDGLKLGEHSLTVVFPSGAVLIQVPQMYAVKFLSDIERHYDSELRSLESEFERL